VTFPSWVRRLRAQLLRTPGSTVDVASWAALLRQVAEFDRTAGLADEALAERFATIAAAAAADDPAALAEALALSRAAAERTLGLRPYDEQLLGARGLLSGRVVQMATGEGKTLVAALAATLLAERGPVRVLTVNDYLARRDAEWMGPLYRRLGRTVGWVVEASTAGQRRAAYAADVTYGAVTISTQMTMTGRGVDIRLGGRLP
jgi:preprotein translocase subunit SecA